VQVLFFVGRCRVDVVELLFVVPPRRLAHRGGCHTLAQLCLPRPLTPPLLKNREPATATRAASGKGITQLAVSAGLWPGRAFIFYVASCCFVL